MAGDRRRCSAIQARFGAERPRGGAAMSAARRSVAHHALGRAVRVARAQRGLSQEALGFDADIHRNYIGSIERGELNPTYALLLRLARGLASPLSELVALAEEIERVEFGREGAEGHGRTWPSSGLRPTRGEVAGA
jgi:transcriptional regulator with XRE-family HTH domain